jgi:hypothetical protein
MTMATTRLANPPQKTPAPPARGSAERAAVIAMVVAVVFQPILHPTGPGNSSPVDLFIVAAIVVAMVWLAGTHRKLRAPYVIPAALFIAAGAASGLVSPLPTTALVTVAIDILLFAWCTTAVNVLAGPRAMRYALVAWSWSGIVWAAIFIAAWLGHVTALEGLNAAEGNRLAFTFGDPNYASWFWDSTIFVVYACAPSRRWMRFVSSVILLWALILTESNGGVLARRRRLVPADVGNCRHGWAGVWRPGWLSASPGIVLHRAPANKLRNWPRAAAWRCWSAPRPRRAGTAAEPSPGSIELYQRGDGMLDTPGERSRCSPGFTRTPTSP